MVNRRSDNLLIGYLLGPVALGYYNVAYRFLTTVFSVVSNTINKVGMPAFVRIQGDRARVPSAFYTVSQLTALISMPLFLGLFVFAPKLVPQLFGRQWTPNVPLMEVLVFISIIQCILTPMVSEIVGLGRPDRRWRLQLFDAVANVVGFVVAVQWGIVEVAISYLIVSYIQAPLWFRTVNSLLEIKITDYLKTLLAPLAGVVVIIVVIMALKYVLADTAPVYVQLVTGTLLGAAAYCRSIYLLASEAASKVISMVKTFILQQKKLKA
jgi:O-antigen/teichoic acid export membrane protein